MQALGRLQTHQRLLGLLSYLQAHSQNQSVTGAESSRSPSSAQVQPCPSVWGFLWSSPQGNGLEESLEHSSQEMEAELPIPMSSPPGGPHAWPAARQPVPKGIAGARDALGWERAGAGRAKQPLPHRHSGPHLGSTVHFGQPTLFTHTVCKGGTTPCCPGTTASFRIFRGRCGSALLMPWVFPSHNHIPK